MTIDRPSVFLKGNHEEEFFQFYRKFGSTSAKQQKILNHFGIDAYHVRWLSMSLVDSYENESAFFSHAGIDDCKPLNLQSSYDLLNSAFKENLDHVTSKLIVQGHLPMKDVVSYGNHWFVDTGCSIGGTLSALVYPEMAILSSEIK